jgi:xanthine dehydrogenase accessory factor
LLENIDLQVLKTLSTWRSAGKHAILVTVTRTWGSSPRPIGSIMALCEDGSVVGSVSGGCIEDDLIEKYKGGRIQVAYASCTTRKSPVRLTYGVTADEAHQFGLPCGGTIELILEFDLEPKKLAGLVEELSRGKLVVRIVSLIDGSWTTRPTQSPSTLTIDADEMNNTFGPEFRMLIIGAGQIAECLATMAKFSGFSVIVCDPRDEFRRDFPVPGVEIVCDMPDDVVAKIQPDRRTCVIALTHDPKLDDLALLEALNSDAFYLGAIGSHRNQEARRRRMIEHLDQSIQSLARLRGPIGIYIGSKTPPEIAVSVMAEVIAAKNGVALSSPSGISRAKKMREINTKEEDTHICGFQR